MDEPTLVSAPQPEAPRRVGRPWAPGTSGNLSGRPKKTDDVRKAEQIAKEHSPRAMRRLVRMCEDPKTSEAGCLRAIELLLAYGIGKPVLRDGPTLEGITFVVRSLNVSAQPVPGVLASPIAAHVQQPPKLLEEVPQ
jgi:hypothetical protein